MLVKFWKTIGRFCFFLSYLITTVMPIFHLDNPNNFQIRVSEGTMMEIVVRYVYSMRFIIFPNFSGSTFITRGMSILESRVTLLSSASLIQGTAKLQFSTSSMGAVLIATFSGVPPKSWTIYCFTDSEKNAPFCSSALQVSLGITSLWGVIKLSQARKLK